MWQKYWNWDSWWKRGMPCSNLPYKCSWHVGDLRQALQVHQISALGVTDDWGLLPKHVFLNHTVQILILKEWHAAYKLCHALCPRQLRSLFTGSHQKIHVLCSNMRNRVKIGGSTCMTSRIVQNDPKLKLVFLNEGPMEALTKWRGNMKQSD